MKNKKQQSSPTKGKTNHSATTNLQTADAQKNIFKDGQQTFNLTQNDNQFEDSPISKPKQEQQKQTNNNRAQDGKNEQNIPKTNRKQMQISDQQTKIIPKSQIAPIQQTDSDSKNESNLIKRTVESQTKNLKISLSERQNSPQTQFSLANTREIESKIKEIAKFIRKKVKDYSPKSQGKVFFKEQPNNKAPKAKQNKISPLGLKKNSFLNDQNEDSPSKLLTFDLVNEQQIQRQKIIKQIIQKEIIGKVWLQIDLKNRMTKGKLKLDPIKHTYPVSCFKRMILEQNKSLHLREQLKMRQKQELLLKRRELFNNARYQRYSLMRSRKSHEEDQNAKDEVMLTSDNPQNVEHQVETVSLLTERRVQIEHNTKEINDSYDDYNTQI